MFALLPTVKVLKDKDLNERKRWMETSPWSQVRGKAEPQAEVIESCSTTKSGIKNMNMYIPKHLNNLNM